MDSWNTNVLLEWPVFRGELLVSGRVSHFPGGSKPLGFHKEKPDILFREVERDLESQSHLANVQAR